jgi:hypothetical protein
LTTPTNPAAPLIDPTFLFRFEIPLRHHDCSFGTTTAKPGLELPEECRLASFGALSGKRTFADVRMAWDKTGIAFTVEVSGKKTASWCRDSRMEDSDGFHLWIDTRCSPGIHRATQYCHRFLFMPSGGGPRRDAPMTGLIPINRARQNPKSPPNGSIQVHVLPRHDGYRMAGRIAAAAMTGFDAAQFPRLGIYYAVIDRELGWQTFALSEEYPVVEDPSLWGEATLVK